MPKPYGCLGCVRVPSGAKGKMPARYAGSALSDRYFARRFFDRRLRRHINLARFYQ